MIGRVVFMAHLMKKGKVSFDRPIYSSISGTSSACEKKMRILGYEKKDYFVHRCFLKY